MNGYELSRQWFDFAFENADKISPNHAALYFFAAEHNNRLGWREKFGLPTCMAMEAIGIKNFKTYSKAFNDLVEWGFFRVYQKSKNQYSATIIGLVKNTEANTEALTKAMFKHDQKQVQSIVDIDKPINKEPRSNNNLTPDNFKLFREVSSLFDPKFYNEKKWLKCYDELIRLDNYSEENILQIVKHFRADSFWAGNFQTLPKLRTTNKEGAKYIDVFADKLKNVKSQNNGNTRKQEPEIGDSDRYARAAGKKVY